MRLPRYLTSEELTKSQMSSFDARSSEKMAGWPLNCSMLSDGSAARAPVGHVDAGDGCRTPHVQVLRLEPVLIRRIRDRLPLLSEQEILVDRYAEVRVRLPDRLRARPVVVIIDRVDDGEQLVVLERRAAPSRPPGAYPGRGWPGPSRPW